VGQRRHFSCFPALAVLAGVLVAMPAWSAPAGGGGEPNPSPLPPPDTRPSTPFALGVGAGYAFRLSNDGRNHGGAAHLYGDVPLVWDFALRIEADLMAWGGSPDVDRPIMRAFVAPSLLYAFDDTEAVALVGVGGFGWSEVEIDDPQPPAVFGAGVLVTLGVRFPLWAGVDVEAAIRVPLVLWRSVNTPDGLLGGSPLRASVMGSGGIVIVPVELWQSLAG
jgi:hypothetical protein